MPGTWNGKTAVVTGGGRGFGRAFAEALASRGAHVVLIDLDGDAASQTAAEICAGGGVAESVTGDVTDADVVGEAMAMAASRRGGIDLLLNNAGLHGAEYGKPLTELGVEKVRKMFDVNVHGVVACTLAAVPHMVERPGANVINIASAAAHRAMTAYGASKLAVAGLTIAFAHELGPEGIRVNAISPGFMLTDTIRAETDPVTAARVQALQFLDTDGTEQHIVDAMLFLAGPSAAFVTGETLRVTAGFGAGV